MRYLDLLRERYENMDQRTRLAWGVGISLVLLFLILMTAANERISALEKKRKGREADLVEMMALKHRYLAAKAESQQFAGRLASAGGDDSPAKVIEEIGIKGKSSRITPLKSEERGGFMEDAAEVKIEGVTANEAVNLLYRLEKGDRPVLVKKANLKTRFDDPSRLDLVLTIALLKASPQGQR
ncbi:MAG: general secretion pathway protein GspM [Geobacteraceae bacterium]|nr:general secretion pathway protein GspM [Geobacteraceae bacterium]